MIIVSVNVFVCYCTRFSRQGFIQLLGKTFNEAVVSHCYSWGIALAP